MGYPEESIPVVMERTMANLRLIRDIRDMRLKQGIAVDDVGPFEVTQLVNSFLGALAHPWEELLKNKTPEDYPELRLLMNHLSGYRSFGEHRTDIVTLLGFVRNAFAHNNIEFLPSRSSRSGRRDIHGVRLWNCTLRGREKNWEIELDVDALYMLLEDFTQVASRLYNRNLVRRERDCPNDPAD